MSPALQIPDSWRVAGLLVALVLLLYHRVAATFGRGDLGRSARRRGRRRGVRPGVLVGQGLASWRSATPTCWSSSSASSASASAAGVPIAFCFGISTFAYVVFATTAPRLDHRRPDGPGHVSTELLAVPMFVLLGLLLEMSGIARVLVDLLSALIGHKRGGLSYVLLAAMYLISGISGSKAADQAAVAPVLLPEMKRRGADPGELAAQLAASAAMSETIPPSLLLIIVGSVTGVSIAALFTGGLLPATVAAFALVVVVACRSRNETPVGKQAADRPHRTAVRHCHPRAGPAVSDPFRGAGGHHHRHRSRHRRRGLYRRGRDGRVRRFRLAPRHADPGRDRGAVRRDPVDHRHRQAMGWALTQAGFAQTLADIMVKAPGGQAGFMAISIVLFVVLGSVLEGLPAMVLFGPLLFPIAKQLGINEVHYAIVAILAMGIGLFSPPFGVGFYQSCLIGRVSSDAALGRIWPYMAALLLALAVVAAIPWMSTGFLG